MLALWLTPRPLTCQAAHRIAAQLLLTLASVAARVHFESAQQTHAQTGQAGTAAVTAAVLVMAVVIAVVVVGLVEA